MVATWWRACISVTGIQGLPTNLAQAGNALYKELTMKCSMRLNPNQNAAKINEKL
jgi:hypothetical protein